jgi:hypothetical protein
MYDLKAGAVRLPAVDDHGQRLAGDLAPLGDVQIRSSH